jgi:DNA modification methylase
MQPFQDRIKALRRVPAGSLRINPKNWRTHPPEQKAALNAVLCEIGFADAVLARECPDGGLELIDGHLRAELAPETEIPVLVLDVDQGEADKLLATLDPLAAMAAADSEKLDALLAGIETGSAELKAMLDDLAKQSRPQTPDAEIVEDVVPDAASVPVRCKRGDLWTLGAHRLICGDCRDPEDVARLLAGERINVAMTSPPYASQRDYDESSGFKPIPPDEYVRWWEAVQANVKENLAGDGSFFVNIKPCADGLDTHLYVFDLVIAHVRRWDWHFATEFCWERTGVPKGVTRRFKNQFEPVYQFALGDWKMRPEAVRHESNDVPMSLGAGSGNTGWATRQGKGGVIPSNRRPRRAGKTSTKSLDQMQGTGADVGDYVAIGMAFPGNRLPTFTGSHDATGHAAAFPVGLPAFFIKAFSDAGDVVYEPFCGSGSTLIAAQQLARKCRAVEISPNYCDVILARWEKLSGEKAVREDVRRPIETTRQDPRTAPDVARSRKARRRRRPVSAR